MNIRKALEKDIPQILNLLDQVNFVHNKLRPDLFSRCTKYNQQELKELLNKESSPIFVCVDDDDNVLGHGFCILEDYSNVDLRANNYSLYIDDICVDKNHRRKGVAKKIYNYILEYGKSKGCTNVHLHVWEGNTAASEFYTKMGMKPMYTALETIL